MLKERKKKRERSCLIYFKMSLPLYTFKLWLEKMKIQMILIHITRIFTELTHLAYRKCFVTVSSIIDTPSYIVRTILERVTDVVKSENANSDKRPLFLTLLFSIRSNILYCFLMFKESESTTNQVEYY